MNTFLKHNDLVSNFLFLASCIGKYEKGLIEQPEYSYYKTNHKIHNDEIVVNRQVLKMKSAYSDIESIFNILKNKFSFKSSVFEDENKMLLSRFFENNWRTKIKQDLYQQLRLGQKLNFLKQQISYSLEELNYRLDLDFTWDLHNSIEMGWHETRNTEINESSSIESIIPIQINEISGDLNWVKDLTEKEIRQQSLMLNENASLTLLVKTIIKLIEDRRYFNSRYLESYNNEVKKLCDFLFGYSTDTNFDLSFINKNKELDFVKLFLCLQNQGYISSTKGEVEVIFSEIFNRGKRTFQDLNKDVLAKEIENNMGFIYTLNKDVLNPFKKKL